MSKGNESERKIEREELESDFSTDPNDYILMEAGSSFLHLKTLLEDGATLHLVIFKMSGDDTEMHVYLTDKDDISEVVRHVPLDGYVCATGDIRMSREVDEVSELLISLQSDHVHIFDVETPVERSNAVLDAMQEAIYGGLGIN